MRRPFSASFALFILAIASTAQATITLNLDLRPTSPTTVEPGQSVAYEIVGLLGGDPTMGLALVGMDLHSSYAIPNGLPRALPGPQMYSFVQPWGINNPPGPAGGNPLNPSGYGGTPEGYDWLQQMGGGQNTIGNPPPPVGVPYPSGPVVLGIAFQPVQIAFGVANLPSVPGTYTLTISHFFANAITGGGTPNQFGMPFYSVTEVSGYSGQSSFDITVLPEPATALLMGALLLATLRQGRRRA